MKNYIYTVATVLALFFVSCEEVIEIDLNSSSPVIVAEGKIRNDTTAFLSLSYSSDYFTVEESQSIADAVVNISDDRGNVSLLKYLSDGLYHSETFSGVNGRTYTMTFEIAGHTYTAQSTLMSPTRVLELSFESIDMGMREQIQDATFFIPTVLISDDSAQDNYYRFVFYVDDEKQEGFFLANDRAAEDGQLSYSPFRLAIEGGGQVRVEVYSIDEATYNYYSQLDDLSGGMMGSSTPYNPQSNFGDEVMGFFSAYSSDVYVTSLEVEE